MARSEPSSATTPSQRIPADSHAAGTGAAHCPPLGVLLVNLGTPEAPTASALRTYLRQFLSDRRVIELPRLLWWPILYGVILNTRPRQSAEKYARIWSPEGSPLAVNTAAQSEKLARALNKIRPCFQVDWAMRYGTPSIAARLAGLQNNGCQRIVVIPLYPQYSASTTASTMDDIGHYLQRSRHQPQLRIIHSFYRDSGYIAALARQVRRHWRRHGRGKKLLMSFHGMPQSAIDQGDPYHEQCLVTAAALAHQLQLAPDEWQATFQSRFGRAHWLQPYTQPTLEALAAAGVDEVDILCPGFPSDCLETLEEIGMECRDAFLQAGGRHYHYIPCLNADPCWVIALRNLVLRETQGWL